jgi:diaminohydroxyphosphoribosylaminopyrimidine deaminase / 5-amino-6-(5-phosphoribosylamino)uracil reductase
LDSQLRMPTTAKIATVPGRCWLLTCSNDASKRNALEKVGFETHFMDHIQGTMKLDAIMAFLAGQQINSLLVETGAILNGALLAQQWIDEYIIYMSPCVLGHQGRGLFTLANMHSMADKKNLTLIDTRQIGPDLKLTLTPQ